VPVQLQKPPPVDIQVADAKPIAGKITPILSQVTVVPDICMHDGANVNCSLPVVVVLSTNDPSDLAVNVPLTWRDPATGADVQPIPSIVRSNPPPTVRHDEVTTHVPTTLPPQSVTLEQDDTPRSNTIVPVVVGLVVCGGTVVVCGVTVNAFPEAQYEYRVLPSVVNSLPEFVYVPPTFFKGSTPIPPGWLTVNVQLHPPPAAAVQSPDTD